MLLPHERKAKAAALKDSRPLAHRIAGAERRPVPVAPPSRLEQDIALAEAEVRKERLAKMTPAQQQLERLREMRDREEVAAGRPHPRIGQIEKIIDSILLNGGREFSHYENALLCLQQHGEGLCPDTADRLWHELLEQEKSYADGVEASINERRTALEAELAALNQSRGALPTAANQFNLLRAAAYGPQAIPFPPGSEGYADEIRNAAGNADAEAAVVAKYADQIRTYEEGR